ncbi:MAG TPA: phosphotransferase [Acidimicrobiia bacterium]|nr:phosphotransferase [Acidimicrobiia bacterium]
MAEKPANSLTSMDHNAPLPTAEQLDALGRELGRPTRFGQRIVGGLGGTVDVLIVGHDPGEAVVLKRYWLSQSGEISPAESEFRALALAVDRGISAPSPIWVDRVGLFPERAIVMSYVEGAVLLDPTDPNDWASQLAHALIEVHRIQPASTDRALFPVLGHSDGHLPETETLAALRRHPLGMDLWARRVELANLRPEDQVYVHRDFWPGNTLWTEQKLAAVIDWEGGAIADPALDVAYCAFDIRLLGLSEAAEVFIEVYRQNSGRSVENLPYWELLALCRPMPDIAIWVPGWQAMGVEITVDEARRRHTALITAALE